MENDKRLCSHPNTCKSTQMRLKIKHLTSKRKLKELEDDAQKFLDAQKRRDVHKFKKRINTELSKMNRGGRGARKWITGQCTAFVELALQMKTENQEADERRKLAMDWR